MRRTVAEIGEGTLSGRGPLRSHRASVCQLRFQTKQPHRHGAGAGGRERGWSAVSGGGRGGVGVGKQVEVEGTRQANGSVLAKKVGF